MISVVYDFDGDIRVREYATYRGLKSWFKDLDIGSNAFKENCRKSGVSLGKPLTRLFIVVINHKEEEI